MTLSPNDFIGNLYGKTINVKLNSGLLYKGVLTALDGSMNMALENTIECFANGEQGESYGDAFIRGNNVLYITPQE
jgi:U6 snRNA-associated Sm-like protein LSm6